MNHSKTTCTRCGKPVSNPRHIEGVGHFGETCYARVSGIQHFSNQFGVWLEPREASLFQRRLERFGVKYRKHSRDADNMFGYEALFCFVGFKADKKTPRGSLKTFAEIRDEYAAKLTEVKRENRP